MFVSSVEPIYEKEGNTTEILKMHKINVEDRINKYCLQPLSIGFFGGILDFNRMGFLTRKGMEAAFKEPLKRHNFHETSPSLYDLRDWNKIRNWTKDLAKKVSEDII